MWVCSEGTKQQSCLHFADTQTGINLTISSSQQTETTTTKLVQHSEVRSVANSCLDASDCRGFQTVCVHYSKPLVIHNESACVRDCVKGLVLK